MLPEPSGPTFPGVNEKPHFCNVRLLKARIASVFGQQWDNEVNLAVAVEICCKQAARRRARRRKVVVHKVKGSVSPIPQNGDAVRVRHDEIGLPIPLQINWNHPARRTASCRVNDRSAKCSVSLVDQYGDIATQSSCDKIGKAITVNISTINQRCSDGDIRRNGETAVPFDSSGPTAFARRSYYR